MKLSYDNIEHYYAKKGYKFYKGKYNINIFGIRCQTDANEFDDLIGIAYQNSNDIVEVFTATTDPGRYYLNSPMNKKGTAILVEGQYKYKTGLHKGKAALVQKAKVKVFRDNNKDNKHDKGFIDEGFFYINIHRAGKNSTQIDKWSAGCQVFSTESQFLRFLNIVNESKKLYGNSFTYSLFSKCDFS